MHLNLGEDGRSRWRRVFSSTPSIPFRIMVVVMLEHRVNAVLKACLQSRWVRCVTSFDCCSSIFLFYRRMDLS